MYRGGTTRTANNAAATINLIGWSGQAQLGGSGRYGSVLLKHSTGGETVLMNGKGHLSMGGNGSNGAVMLYDGDGNRAKNAEATISHTAEWSEKQPHKG